MAHTRSVYNAPNLLYEGCMLLKYEGLVEETRNGTATTIPDPVVITVHNPMERVVFDPVRNANHFFHVMEFVWMMAGERDVRWIAQFNSNMANYADEGTTINHGAYGHRWRKMFNRDQLVAVVALLKQDVTTRRAVLGMWDPRFDMDPHADLPCNTHIYFRWDVEMECLDMTVCNRSNDLIWGMAGANIVHMTFLHQIICEAVGVDIGNYNVMTNNLHIYDNVPEIGYYMDRIVGPEDRYEDGLESHMDILQDGDLHEFLVSCEHFISNPGGTHNDWMGSVAQPMYHSYMQRKSKKGDGHAIAETIAAPDWRLACLEWIERKESAC